MKSKVIAGLPSLDDAQRTRRATRKHETPTRLAERTKQDHENAKRDLAFRAEVWRLDGGRCAVCGCRCVRTLRFQKNRGEVHHLSGRNVAPQDRYNPARARLLCLEDHGRAERYEITVSERTGGRNASR